MLEKDEIIPQDCFLPPTSSGHRMDSHFHIAIITSTPTRGLAELASLP